MAIRVVHVRELFAPLQRPLNTNWLCGRYDDGSSESGSSFAVPKLMIAAAEDHTFIPNHHHLLVPLAPGPCELLRLLWVDTRS
jgi:hypothetical protein